jgi:hypothetical protein
MQYQVSPFTHLLLGEGEGGQLDGCRHHHDGPAIAVGHVQALQAVLQGVW